MTESTVPNNVSERPVISAVIPSYPDSKIPESIRAVKQQDYPASKMEIIHVQGCNLSRQRNEGIKAARGEVIYFLDEDSLPTTDAFKRLARLFAGRDTVLAGGPNVAPARDTLVGQAVDIVWTSYFGVFGKKSRYAPVGSLRPAQDSNLIGCNLAIRRTVFDNIGFFNEQLIPNEENHLIEKMRQAHPDENLLYDPELVVVRARPSSLSEYARKIFRYGAGRARQWKSGKSATSNLHIFILVLLFVGLATASFSSPGRLILLVMAGCYTALALQAAVAGGCKKRNILVAMTSLWLFPLTHISYTLGMITGLFRRWRTNPTNNPPIKLTFIPHKDNRS